MHEAAASANILTRQLGGGFKDLATFVNMTTFDRNREGTLNRFRIHTSILDEDLQTIQNQTDS